MKPEYKDFVKAYLDDRRILSNEDDHRAWVDSSLHKAIEKYGTGKWNFQLDDGAKTIRLEYDPCFSEPDADLWTHAGGNFIVWEIERLGYRIIDSGPLWVNFEKT